MMSKPAISIFSQLRTPVAQEGAGSENFLLRKQEFTVLQCSAAEPQPNMFVRAGLALPEGTPR
jgi:hypothetical protein